MENDLKSEQKLHPSEIIKGNPAVAGLFP